MPKPYRAIVEVGCQCGERLELPIEQVRLPFDCHACDYVHVLGREQLEAIEQAFGRALIDAHRHEEGGVKSSLSARLRH